MMKKFIGAAAIVAAVGVAQAFTQSDVHFWVGDDAGTNKCVVVIDWAGEAKAWGYQWNGDCTNLLEVIRRIAREDNRLEFRYQKMTASYYDLYFFGYDTNDAGVQWETGTGASSDPEALVGREDSVSYSQWWVLYGPMKGVAFPKDAQYSSLFAANSLVPVNGDWFVFSLGAPEYDASWNESPAVLTMPTAAESPYGYEVTASSIADSTSATYNNPTNALGRPTTYMSGQWGGPVSPYNSAWMAQELVSLDDEGSYIVIKFDHDVMDDEANPWGLDFIVFGNSFGVGTTKTYYTQTTPPENVKFTGEGSPEPARVLVSQDGKTWYEYSEKVYADDWAPTLGRVYDETNPEASLFAGNLWWGLPTDACYPVSPAKGWANLKGLTLKQVAQYYNGSAGGTGYDLKKFTNLPATRNGKRWIRYVKILPAWDEDEEEWTAPDIDAVSDVSPVRGFRRWQIANYDWDRAWDSSLAGEEAIAANGQTNGLNYILGYSASETVTLAFEVKDFTPGTLTHQLSVLTKQPLASASGLFVEQASALKGPWVSEIPNVKSAALDPETGFYVNVLEVANQGSFLKLSLGE